MDNNKAISPVIGVSLLVIVSVVAVISFQQWYQGYQSILSTDTEQKSSKSNGGVDIQYISDDGIIYVTNGGSENISMNSIKVGDTNCNQSVNLTPGVNKISILSCLDSGDSISEIMIVTDDDIFQESVYSGDVIQTTVVISLSASLSCSTDLDGDGYISYNCALYPMSNVTFEGHLDIDDNNNTITIDYDCRFRSDKSTCETNFIDNGCGSGTVLDIGTGLCWQKDMSAGGSKTWANAFVYCETTLDGLGGHNDWRLPTRQELLSIIDYSRVSPSIVGGNNNKFTSVASSYYWTSTTFPGNPTAAYTVGVWYGGGDGNLVKTGVESLVCVRNN